MHFRFGKVGGFGADFQQRGCYPGKVTHERLEWSKLFGKQVRCASSAVTFQVVRTTLQPQTRTKSLCFQL